MTLTAELLRKEVSYDPETGAFKRLLTRGFNPKSAAGDVVGRVGSGGYLYFRVLSKRYLAHRLAWLYVYGEWPEWDIDHKNGQASDNRIANLRMATRSQNMANTATQRNNRSGVRGVIFDKATGRWMAYLNKDRKFINLGRFDTVAEASEVRSAAFSAAFQQFAGRGA